jgi:opacity protein-like surface antigen
MTRARPWLWMAMLVIGVPATARAQQTAAPRPRSFELSVGGIAVGAIDFGAATASLIANQSGASESTLFRTTSTIGTGLGLDARAAFNITRALAVEGGFVWTRATLESRITSDVEGIPNTTVAQDLDTYFIEASAVWHLRGLSFAGGRVLPFVAGGAGYLRQLDEDAMLTTQDSGRVYHAGGGLKYFFMQRRRGFIRGMGLRTDARLYVRSGGVELDQDTTRRKQWAVAASLLVRF